MQETAQTANQHEGVLLQFRVVSGAYKAYAPDGRFAYEILKGTSSCVLYATGEWESFALKMLDEYSK